MQCPKCSGQLKEGSGRVRGTFWGYFAVGLSYQHFWFEHRDGKRDIVIPSGGVRRAYCCPECETVVIPG